MISARRVASALRKSKISSFQILTERTFARLDPTSKKQLRTPRYWATHTNFRVQLQPRVFSTSTSATTAKTEHSVESFATNLKKTIPEKEEIEARISELNEEVQERMKEMQNSKQERPELKAEIEELKKEIVMQELLLTKKNKEIQEIELSIRRETEHPFKIYLRQLFQKLKQDFTAPVILTLLLLGVNSVSNYKNRKDNVMSKEQIRNNFLQLQEKNTQHLVKEAGMVITPIIKESYSLNIDDELIPSWQVVGFDNIEQVEKFVGNWEISRSLLNASKEKELKTEKGDANIIYFYGHPGIGKSTFFATLIYHLKQEETRHLFQEWFPFFKNYENFIFIDAQSLEFQTISKDQYMQYVNYLNSNNYLIVIDDSQHLVASSKGRDFLKHLVAGSSWVILLSSQAPTHSYYKNKRKHLILTELPHFEAVQQIRNSFVIQNNSLAQVTPPCQAQYFAYRMWFYLGGNLSLFRTILSKDIIYHTNYFHEAYMSACRESFYQMATETEASKITKKDILFQRLFQLVARKYEQSLCDLTKLNFKIHIKYEKDKKDSDEFDYFQNKNILLKKHIKLNNKEGKVVDQMNTIEFQSRRTQYSFGMWILDDYQAYWKKPSKGFSRVKYQQLLQRIEYQYLLDFGVYKLKKKLKQIQAGIDNQKGKWKVEDYESLIRLVQTEIELTMDYYQAYQETKNQSYSTKLEFVPKKIMSDLKLGPDHFYLKYKQEIEKVFRHQSNMKQKIEEAKAVIQKERSKEEVLELRKFVQKQESEEYIRQFDACGGFKLQKLLTRQNFDNHEIISPQKVEQALIQLKNATISYEKQAITTALELAIDAHERMVSSHKSIEMKEVNLKAKIKEQKQEKTENQDKSGEQVKQEVAEIPHDIEQVEKIQKEENQNKETECLVENKQDISKVEKAEEVVDTKEKGEK